MELLPTNDQRNHSILDDVLKTLTEEGTGGILKVMTTLMNEAMKIERSSVLKAAPYERAEDRTGHANGYKDKTINTSMGKITLDIPQARGISFYPQCLEKGMRSERALKLAIAEMYVTGVSTRKVTEITEKLCGMEISSTQVSRLTKLLDVELYNFRNRQLGQMRYLLLDAIYEKIRHNGIVISLPVLIAIGINKAGKREVLGISVGLSEAEIHWREFLVSLVNRGLTGLELITSDDHPGLKAARKSVFPSVPWQRCQFHIAQNAQQYAPKKSMRIEIGQEVRNIFNSPTIEDAREYINKVINKYNKKAPEFVNWLNTNIEEGLVVYNFPKEHRIKIRTANMIERLNKEIRRRTRVAGLFPNQESVLRLVTALLQEEHEGWETEAPYVKILE
ncbi:MAG: IS256 family transposase [Oligoflexia bacterium]|nr:IS256 family transposase [Oligoflexia bacterium]